MGKHLSTDTAVERNDVEEIDPGFDGKYQKFSDSLFWVVLVEVDIMSSFNVSNMREEVVVVTACRQFSISQDSTTVTHDVPCRSHVAVAFATGTSLAIDKTL
jgi:hypothetical protein